MSTRAKIAVNNSGDRGFAFSGKPRKIEPVEAMPFRWPTTGALGNEYISCWHDEASKTLAGLRLSRDTLRTLASQISRRDGTTRMKNEALAARSRKSLATTKRDIKRLKDLGFLIVEYEGGNSIQDRVRVLKIAVPDRSMGAQRIPPVKSGHGGSTYTPYVEPLDIGASRDA